MKFEELFTQPDNYLSTLPSELKIALTQYLAASSLNTKNLTNVISPIESNDEAGTTVIAFQPGILPPDVTLNQLQEWTEATGARLQEHQFYNNVIHSNWFNDNCTDCNRVGPSCAATISIPVFLLFGAVLNFVYHDKETAWKMLLSALLFLALGVSIIACYYATTKLKWKYHQTHEELKTAVQAGKEKYGFLQTLSKWNDVDPEIAKPLQAHVQSKKSATEATPLLRIECSL